MQLITKFNYRTMNNLEINIEWKIVVISWCEIF